jgi:hypothetical protein
VDPDDTRAILRGAFDLNATLVEISRDVNALRNWFVETMEKRKRIGKREISAEFWKRHRETQAILAERIAYHERRKAEKDRASGDASSQ